MSVAAFGCELIEVLSSAVQVPGPKKEILSSGGCVSTSARSQEGTVSFLEN